MPTNYVHMYVIVIVHHGRGSNPDYHNLIDEHKHLVHRQNMIVFYLSEGHQK